MARLERIRYDASTMVLILGCLMVLGSHRAYGEPTEYRTISDQRGRTIEVRVLHTDGVRVTLERRNDGRRFTVGVSQLSAADQDYFRRLAESEAWQTSNNDWHRFRGPSGMGTSDATGVPIEWGKDQGVVWKTPLPGAGASSPITFGDRVYVTAYTGYLVPGEPTGRQTDLERHLIAVRLEDGQILWSRTVAATLPESDRIRDHGFASSSVVVDAERVYVFFGVTGVLAFDHDGNRLWQTSVGTWTSNWGSAASPILYRDLVLVNATVESESLIALDRQTGVERWRVNGIREAWNTPLVITAESGREELVIATQGSIQAFDPNNGRPYWSCKSSIGWYMVPSLVAADGRVYCLGGRSGIAALAVRAGGEGDVTDSHRLWTIRRGTNVSSPVVLDGHLYWAHESRELAYCVEAATGSVVYENPLQDAGSVYASALLVDDRIYYVTRSGKTFVLAAKPQFEQLAVNDLADGSAFDASPAVAGNRLLLRSNRYLYCLGTPSP